MKLPSIPLPFPKKRPPAAVEEDVDADTAAATAGPSEGRLGRTLEAVATVVLAVLVIGGTGAVVGWLAVNAETTEARRMLLQPHITVPVLADGQTPEPNSSEPAASVADSPAADGPATDPADGGQAGGPSAGASGSDAQAPQSAPGDGVRLADVDPALLQVKDDLQLPIIGADGRQPWSAYGRPFNVDDSRPRIAIVMVGLGLGRQVTERAIADLPGAVSLSFSPYARDIEAQLASARDAGHEVLIDLPMEPLDFPRDDPGPSTLLTSLSLVDNLNRLEWVLGRATGYVGVTTWMGSQFTTVEDALMPVLDELKDRGLMLVDSRASSRSIATELASSIQLPRAFNNAFVDDRPSSDAIDRTLAGLEATARQHRHAVGVARPLPVTLDRLARWAATLDGKGIALAPVSAVADRQRLR